MTHKNPTFPPGFVWGAATSAYQIEGSWDRDGKVPSVWDDFCHNHVPPGSTGNIPGQVFSPGNVFSGQTGDVAADHYQRFASDVGLMQQIGLQAYRFSVSWPRIIPGIGERPNAKGLDFYSRLVDALLDVGIAPWVTLFHWDLPLWASHRGGWLHPDVHQWFAEYTAAVVDRLGDRVRHWITINEPQIFLGPSEHEGVQTSNSRKSHCDRLLAAHHALLCHGRAVAVIRARTRVPAQVGWAPIGRIKVPYGQFMGGRADGGLLSDPTTQDVAAARAATGATLARDFWTNAWFADPVIFGRYPQDGLSLYGTAAPAAVRNATEQDMKTICQPIDFYGVNIYDAEMVRACEPHRGNSYGPTATYERVDFAPGWPRTAIGWNVVPEALYYGPKFLYEKYKVPIVVTENGLSNTDWVSCDGGVHDPQRIDYTRRYLLQYHRAMRDGVALGGYFHWSLMDNMEWQNGYRDRFGLIHVDFGSLERTLKDSAKWYRGVIHSHGESLSISGLQDNHRPSPEVSG